MKALKTLLALLTIGVVTLTQATPVAAQTTFIVNSTGDAGPGSLRQAILDANVDAANDLIEFSIPGPGPHTIQPVSALPTITNPVVIDGYTQPGAAAATSSTPATLMIELDGTNAGASADGLVLTAPNSTIRGLVIIQFDGVGVRIQGTGGNTIAGNYIGTDVSGTTNLGTTFGAVIIVGSDNLLGGTTAGARNIVIGVDIQGSRNRVQGNYIGTDVSGTSSLRSVGTPVPGILITGSDNMIGGTSPGARNIISGNGGPIPLSTDPPRFGIEIEGSSATGNQVMGNYMGTSPVPAGCPTLGVA